MSIDSETARLMENWAAWKTGASISAPVSGAYDLEARGRREEVPIPLLNGEAVDVDRAVSALDRAYQAAIAEYWLRAGTNEQKAKRCHCSLATYWRRLEFAHQRIGDQLNSVREQAARDRNERSRREAERLDADRAKTESGWRATRRSDSSL